MHAWATRSLLPQNKGNNPNSWAGYSPSTKCCRLASSHRPDLQIAKRRMLCLQPRGHLLPARRICLTCSWQCLSRRPLGIGCRTDQLWQPSPGLQLSWSREVTPCHMSYLSDCIGWKVYGPWGKEVSWKQLLKPGVCDHSRLFLALLGSKRHPCPLSGHVQTALCTNRVRKSTVAISCRGTKMQRCVALVRKCGHHGDLKSLSLKCCGAFQTKPQWSHRWIQSQFCTSVASMKPEGKCSFLKGKMRKRSFQRYSIFKGTFSELRMILSGVAQGKQMNHKPNSIL